MPSEIMNIFLIGALWPTLKHIGSVFIVKVKYCVLYYKRDTVSHRCLPYDPL